ncbi:spoIIIJ-associated protein [Leucobacter luti]|uniref:SpoIIIJ-associated protein n=1 Tax=Leucobacter luti TaxID=340320 RepID=A0A4R6S2I4_9MICO|nr:spoIIIJ-associated protein [Leucobacter luti]TCK39894.1 spoIIIJ-associated protein [Leucobacter luti]TDP93247.1 spoIIIJ-associated protein [Leucobacter luti]
MIVTQDNDAPTQESSELSLAELEADGDLAADYVEGLLDIADLDGDIDIDVANGRAYVSVTGGDAELERLAGADTVQALQDLTRLAVQAKTGRFSRLIIDVGGSRNARATELKGMVDAAVAQIAAGRDEVELEPMSSYERKLVHDDVAERGYFSESRGEGRDRRLVISRA